MLYDRVMRQEAGTQALNAALLSAKAEVDRLTDAFATLSEMLIRQQKKGAAEVAAQAAEALAGLSASMAGAAVDVEDGRSLAVQAVEAEARAGVLEEELRGTQDEVRALQAALAHKEQELDWAVARAEAANAETEALREKMEQVPEPKGEGAEVDPLDAAFEKRWADTEKAARKLRGAGGSAEGLALKAAAEAHKRKMAQSDSEELKEAVVELAAKLEAAEQRALQAEASVDEQQRLCGEKEQQELALRSRVSELEACLKEQQRVCDEQQQQLQVLRNRISEMGYEAYERAAGARESQEVSYEAYEAMKASMEALMQQLRHTHGGHPDGAAPLEVTHQRCCGHICCWHPCCVYTACCLHACSTAPESFRRHRPVRRRHSQS